MFTMRTNARLNVCTTSTLNCWSQFANMVAGWKALKAGLPVTRLFLQAQRKFTRKFCAGPWKGDCCIEGSWPGVRMPWRRIHHPPPRHKRAKSLWQLPDLRASGPCQDNRDPQEAIPNLHFNHLEQWCHCLTVCATCFKWVAWVLICPANTTEWKCASPKSASTAR